MRKIDVAGSAFHTTSVAKALYASAVVSALLSFTGCGMPAVAPVASSSSHSKTHSLTGTVHGGFNPVEFATVKLYSAGTTGYGSASTVLASTTTNSSGVFSIPTWMCPSDSDPQVYITSIGGNTLGNGNTAINNGAAGFLVALGPCSTASPSVELNEINTVASVFALAQFINPGWGPGNESIGAQGANTPGTASEAAIGLNNAQATVVNLANISTGQVATATNRTGVNTSVTSLTVTATPESAKIVTIANILAACIDAQDASSSGPCPTIFSAATPPPSASVTSQPSTTFHTAQDTIQAAYFMAVNPIDAGTQVTSCFGKTATTNIQCLYKLANTDFAGGLTVQPSDWTIGITFTATGTSNVCNSTTNWNFFNAPAKVAVDAGGNLWFVNGSSSGNYASFGGISHSGKPLACVGNASTTGSAGNGITVDPSGNIWASFQGSTNGQLSVLELPASQIGSSSQSTTLWQTPYSADTILSDGNGDIFFTSGNQSTPGHGGLLYELPNPGATTYTSSTIFPATLVQTGLSTGTTTGTFLIDYAATDHPGNIWMANNTNEYLNEAAPTSLGISGYTIASGNVVTFYTGAKAAAPIAAGKNIVVTGMTTTDGLKMDHQGFTVTSTSTNSPYTVTATLITSPGSGANPDAPASPSLPVVTTEITDTTGSLTGYALSTYSPGSTNAHTFRGIALDSNEYIYTGSQCCSTGDRELYKVTTGSPHSSLSGSTVSTSAQYLGGENGIRAMAVDGADNLWFGGQYPSSTMVASGQSSYAIGEASTSGSGTTATFTALSPAGTSPGTCTSSSTAPGCPDGGGYIKTSFQVAQDIAIDPSGNVWVPATSSYALSGSTYTLTENGTSITEIVGAAVPTETPLSVSAGFNLLGQEPTQQTQTVSFTAIPSPQTYTPGLQIALSATASTGLPITFSVTSGPASVTGTTLNILGLGTVVVAATQPGNYAYAQATASQSISVTSANIQTPVTGTPARLTLTSTTNTIAPGFAGLSYEKYLLSDKFFNGNVGESNTPLINLFNLLGPSVLRIGGGSTDKIVWNASGSGNTGGEVSPTDIAALKTFLQATHWKCLYAVNLGGYYPSGPESGYTTAQAEALDAAEVAEVVLELGIYDPITNPSGLLLGIEIGNEPDNYGGSPTDYYGSGWTESIFESSWEAFRNAIVTTTPSVAGVITGPATADIHRLPGWTLLFGQQFITNKTPSQVSILTQHYYSNPSPATGANLILPDTNLTSYLSYLSTGVPPPGSGDLTMDGSIALGVPNRISETNNISNGGVAGVSNAYASALWALNFLFDTAYGGSSGVNFHGGGHSTSGYTPIADNSGATNGFLGVVEAVRPEYYGILLFSMAGSGALYTPAITGTSLNVTAFAVKTATGGTNVIINNNDPNTHFVFTVAGLQQYNLGNLYELSCPGCTPPILTALSGMTIQGASFGVTNSTGTWSGAAPSPTYVDVSGTITVYIPPLSAILLQLN